MYEIVLQITSVVFLIMQVSSNETYLEQIYDLTNIFMLRIVRVVIYCREIQDVELVYLTCTYLTKPILKRFFFLYILFYEYAYLAMTMFGGEMTFAVYSKLNMNGFPFYYLMNFNDLYGSMIVLFQQMVVNNWWVVVDMTASYSSPLL